MIKIIDLPTVLCFMGYTLDQFDVWDDGDGPYIKQWNASVPFPTKKDIETVHKQMIQSKYLEWRMLRQTRDQLLKDSDWTQVPDISLPNKQQWTQWRQELRNLPSDYPSIEDAQQALNGLVISKPINRKSV